MIKVTYKNGSLEVSGHSGYDCAGKDIVCAACSTAVINSYNIIEALGKKDNVSFEMSDGYFRMTVLKEDETVSKILETLVLSLKDLEEQYPNHVKVK